MCPDCQFNCHRFQQIVPIYSGMDGVSGVWRGEILPALIIGIESSLQSQDEEQRGAMSRGDDETRAAAAWGGNSIEPTTTVISSQVCTLRCLCCNGDWYINH